MLPGNGSEGKAGVRKWIEFYNHKLPNSALGGNSPAVVYWQTNETTNPNQQEQIRASKSARYCPTNGNYLT
jgi:hypothetical protein